MSDIVVRVGPIAFGNRNPIVAIGGTCAIETEELTFRVAEHLKRLFARLKVPFVFKASFDKANRSSMKSWRGLGVTKGLEILGRIRERLNVPVLTDIHEPAQAEWAARVVDIIQIPAFLCRQTDLITAAAKTGKPVNVKKGQFLSPWECRNIVDKVRSAGNHQLMLTDRGYMFGYNNLVVDMRSFVIMKGFGVPVIHDATHSQQLPGGLGAATGGWPEFVVPVAQAAAAVGLAGLFFETHPNPARAKSDGPNSIALKDVEKMWRTLLAIDAIVKKKNA
ncbi:MAG: 3-deoxy-8-phosphooctulonate synthase [Elusimicrobia bacterium]|nr:3-deoxy-8-phosphooctulonate synthase [Elusimicrobiota bacterium]